MTRRPLAVVMVAVPTPLTLANLRQLATWADLILTEGTSTIGGEPRTPLRSGWRELLDLAPPQLRVITTDLAGDKMWQRERVQRDSVAPILAFEPADRVVLMVDSDEFLEPEAVLSVIAEEREEPVRLGLVPLYGAVDRVARSIHCCWHENYANLRSPGFVPKRPYIVAAPSVATAGQMRGRSPSGVRFRSPLVDRERTFGTHATMCGPAEETAHKLRNTRDRWVPRVCDPAHLETVLSAGVHHAGWWIAEYREPEPWLLELAAEAGLRVAGPMLPEEHLRALRAWAQARLDPLVPDVLVAAGDAYATARQPDAVDFLPALDEWQREREVTHTGRVYDPADAAEDQHAEAPDDESAAAPGDESTDASGDQPAEPVEIQPADAVAGGPVEPVEV